MRAPTTTVLAVTAALAATALASLARPPAARADYTVHACANDASGPDHLFSAYYDVGWVRGSCYPGVGERTEVHGGSTLNKGGYLQFQAPAGTSIVGYQLDARARWEGGANFAWLVDGGGWSNVAQPGDGGSFPSSIPTDGSWTHLGRTVDWTGFRLATFCNAATCSGNPALIDWKNIDITMRDNAGGPGLYAESGLWGETGWARGARAAGFSASDSVGVRTQRIEIDPGGAHGFGWPIDDAKACDFNFLVPCPTATTTSGSVDTTQLADAAHTLRYSAMDSSGNWTSESRTIRVDNHGPATSVLGAGTSGVPSNGPVDMTLIGTDEPGASGMGGADAGDPIERGGHVDYSVDGGATVQARGDEATVHLAALGSHTISFRAYDVAGNASAPRTLTVVVGAAAPAGGREHSGFWDRSASSATFAAAPSFSNSCPARTTLRPNARAWIDEADPATNHGGTGTLTVRGGDGRRARVLLSFDLPAAAGCSVASAQLRLNQLSGDAGRALSAYRLGSAWSESSVTWANRPGPAGVAAAAASSGNGWSAFDVTSQVRAIYRSGNNGFVVQGDGNEVFDSGPELVVDFG